MLLRFFRVSEKSTVSTEERLRRPIATPEAVVLTGGTTCEPLKEEMETRAVVLLIWPLANKAST